MKRIFLFIPLSAVAGLRVALGDVGVVEALLVLGAQSGGAQGCSMGVLGLAPDKTNRNTKSGLSTSRNAAARQTRARVQLVSIDCPLVWRGRIGIVKRCHALRCKGNSESTVFRWTITQVLLQFSLKSCDFGVQRFLELLLLLQVPQDLPADSLQALHLPLALVHLPLQGLHAQRQLGTERGEARGLEGNRGGQGCGRGQRGGEGGRGERSGAGRGQR